MYKNVCKNIRGITQKLRKGEQSFLCMTPRPDLIHIFFKNCMKMFLTVTELSSVQELIMDRWKN